LSVCTKTASRPHSPASGPRVQARTGCRTPAAFTGRLHPYYPSTAVLRPQLLTASRRLPTASRSRWPNLHWVKEGLQQEPQFKCKLASPSRPTALARPLLAPSPTAATWRLEQDSDARQHTGWHRDGGTVGQLASNNLPVNVSTRRRLGAGIRRRAVAMTAAAIAWPGGPGMPHPDS
jgi:hypothetical protein